ncbi:unnamed protein product [Microthlaspi erraticum]|uniref:Methionyl/Leucyl tRNA synthetase domain-containing protein n=1 Tax=Microthlaspi erraticum TaxID=1685480 RepID=A0A6D2KW99_9BRAS|nr:unnamed protein product [Microthlaspi erraticum]
MEDGNIASPKLPMLGKRNILITSALPNVVDVPHLGNIIGGVLSADVYARYCRLRGYNAIYICGTNDYGSATETKAREKNFTPRQICDKCHPLHKQVYDWFDTSFDWFGKTSTPEHTQLCLEIFNKLWANKLFSDYSIQQIYCGSCRRLLSYWQLEGSFSAVGDDLTLKDLRCKLCQTTPQFRVTEHMLFDIPLLQKKLEEYVDKTSVTGSWSRNVIRTTNTYLRTRLTSIFFTKDQKWGVPVPQEKYKHKV